MPESPDTSQNVREAYQEWAEIYDTNDNATRDLNAQILRRASLPLGGKRVLEIGCGTGLNTLYLARQAAEVVGIDISENMLAAARARVDRDNVRFETGDLTQGWPFESRSFDLLVANLVLEHIDKLPQIFQEAWRVLQHGGRFYLAELHPYKQLQQSQAKYVSPETGREVQVDAFIHAVSDYVTAGLDTGFTLRQLTEHQSQQDETPRLLALLFEK